MTAIPEPSAEIALTVGALRRELASRLRSRWGGQRDGTSLLDARMIVAHAMGLDSSALALHDDEPVAAATVATADAMIERRLVGEPIARIIGEKEFWSLPFRLSPATLVPRPDTETLVQAALDALSASGRRSDELRVLDLGTGSGCILLALLSELPNAFGIGVDRAEGAVVTAAENARRLGLADRARFVAGDWAEAIGGRFDAILANPPYVEEEALPELPVEVIGFDPRLALAGGSHGIDGHKAIIPALPRLLAPSGFAIVELGPRQGPMIADLAATAGMTMEVRHDLAGRERAAFLTIS